MRAAGDPFRGDLPFLFPFPFGRNDPFPFEEDGMEELGDDEVPSGGTATTGQKPREAFSSANFFLVSK